MRVSRLQAAGCRRRSISAVCKCEIEACDQVRARREDHAPLTPAKLKYNLRARLPLFFTFGWNVGERRLGRSGSQSEELVSLLYFFAVVGLLLRPSSPPSAEDGWKGANGLSPLSIKQLLRGLARAQCSVGVRGGRWWGVGGREGQRSGPPLTGVSPSVQPAAEERDKASGGAESCLLST